MIDLSRIQISVPRGKVSEDGVVESFDNNDAALDVFDIMDLWYVT